MNQASQPQTAGRWIGLVIVGVLIAEGVWGLISAITSDLILPVLSREMGGTSQSAQAVNVQGVFGSVIGLCLAGLVAVIVNSWLNRSASGRVVVPSVPVQRVAAGPLSIMSPAPKAAAASAVPATSPVPPPAQVATPLKPVATAPVAAPVAVPIPTSTVSIAPPVQIAAPNPVPAAAKPTASPAPVAAKPAAPAVTKPTAPAKPAKPKPPKEIQYNIVGEPISPMEEDD